MSDPRKNIREVRAPEGPELNAKSWLTEAPLRMIMNNLHPDVAEKPHELVVYGGIGRAARTWPVRGTFNLPLVGDRASLQVPGREAQSATIERPCCHSWACMLHASAAEPFAATQRFAPVSSSSVTSDQRLHKSLSKVKQ